MPGPTLLAVPNVSEGRDPATIAALAAAFAIRGVRLLDVHSDPDHHRSVFTLAGPPQRLADAVLSGAREAVARIDVVARAELGGSGRGQHPYVGAVDVAPVVYLDESARGAACAEALVIADRLGEELCVPVFLYGELTADESVPARSRAQLRRGGVLALARRMRAAELAPDFGPARLHESAGAALVAARPPLVAFNVQLAPPATLEQARVIAAALREGGESGLPGVRAIAVELTGDIAQVSMNVERPHELPLRDVLAAVQARAPVASAELVGLAPRAALAGFPAEVPLLAYNARRHLIENALGCS